MTDSSSPRYPGLKVAIKSFTQSGATDLPQILFASSDSYLMAVIEGIDVTSLESGVTTESFLIDYYQSNGTVFAGTLFGNQVSPPTGLNFSWRGSLSLYNGEQLRLNTLSGNFSASCFGFLAAADNVAR